MTITSIAIHLASFSARLFAGGHGIGQFVVIEWISTEGRSRDRHIGGSFIPGFESVMDFRGDTFDVSGCGG
jgi:hypothetical protein